MLGLQVEDTIFSGKSNFLLLLSETEKKFIVKEMIFTSFEFAEVTIQQTDSGYLGHQFAYALRLNQLSLDVTFEDFRTLRHIFSYFPKRSWTSAIANMFSQVTNEKFTASHVKVINKAIQIIREMQKRGLHFHWVNPTRLQIVGTNDALFSNNTDLSPQL